jgi:uncharacterized membrane protein
MVLFGVIAHSLGCGTFIPAVAFFGLSFAIVLLLSLVDSSHLSKPTLLTLIVAVQLASHYLLGGSSMSSMSSMNMPMTASHMNDGLMLAAHVLGGIVTYLFIRSSEKFWNFAGYVVISLFRAIYIPLRTKKTLTLRELVQAFCSIHTLLHTFLTEAASRLSAPPQVA